MREEFEALLVAGVCATRGIASSVVGKCAVTLTERSICFNSHLKQVKIKTKKNVIAERRIKIKLVCWLQGLMGVQSCLLDY